jgi:hypothetical protein
MPQLRGNEPILGLNKIKGRLITKITSKLSTSWIKNYTDEYLGLQQS